MLVFLTDPVIDLLTAHHGIRTLPHLVSSLVKELVLFTEIIYSFSCSGIHLSARRNALSHFAMPAMSPTMTEGGIASWKKKEGESFTTGDVLLEIVRVFSLPVVKPFNLLVRKPIRRPSTSRLRKMVSWQKLSYEFLSLVGAFH